MILSEILQRKSHDGEILMGILLTRKNGPMKLKAYGIQNKIAYALDKALSTTRLISALIG